MRSTLTVATANTHFGRMLAEQDGMEHLRHADLLLMQEVLTPAVTTQSQLKKQGFGLAHVDTRAGLAIARNLDSLFVPIVDGRDSAELSPAVWSGASRYEHRLAQRMRARSAIGSLLQHKLADIEVFAATAHPVVPARPVARARQVRALGSWLANYPVQNIILGADMNHYPAPRTVDGELENVANMRRVDIGDEPTWRMEGSNSERLGRIAGGFMRRDLASFDGQLDALLYRGDLVPIATEIVDIASDHRAIITEFEIG